MHEAAAPRGSRAGCGQGSARVPQSPVVKAGSPSLASGGCSSSRQSPTRSPIRLLRATAACRVSPNKPSSLRRASCSAILGQKHRGQCHQPGPRPPAMTAQFGQQLCQCGQAMSPAAGSAFKTCQTIIHTCFSGSAISRPAQGTAAPGTIRSFPDLGTLSLVIHLFEVSRCAARSPRATDFSVVCSPSLAAVASPALLQDSSVRSQQPTGTRLWAKHCGWETSRQADCVPTPARCWGPPSPGPVQALLPAWGHHWEKCMKSYALGAATTGRDPSGLHKARRPGLWRPRSRRWLCGHGEGVGVGVWAR